MAVTKAEMTALKVAKLFDVAGKVVLVTGGSTGIGFGITQGFVANGCRVYITSRNKEELSKVAAELTAQGPGQCIAIAANLSKVDECNRLAKEIEQREGKLHVLVNNAGANWAAPYDEYPESGWDKVEQLNVKAVFFLTRACTPLLAAAGSASDPARVINTGSIDGLSINALETYAYSASKAAVHHLTRVLASKLAAQHITVNAIAAGPFQSKMMKVTLDRFGDAITQSTAMGRIGTAEDLTGMCVWLSSRAGAWVTGTIIPLDGGTLVRGRL
eukprot:TRINITY_DN4573_c0_g1_i1.p1 TRINITY_DN4573_c0_g1~~TRINITY_DN4573_c0_g1_i1.p1  ORF type:complete len:273 (-),score=60.73 TRINITY_DN4573_c0_g1_i1:51-869(-)